MKKLITLLFGLLLTITAYSQNGYSSVFLRVTDSATFVNSANTTAKHAAGYAEIWYSTASGLFWKWSTVTNTYTMLGSDGWAKSGTTNLTGDVTVDPGVNDLYIGTTGGTGVQIVGSTDEISLFSPNFLTAVIGAGLTLEMTPTNFTVVGGTSISLSNTASQLLLATDATLGGDEVVLNASSTGTGKDIHLNVTNGDLKINSDPGSAGEVLTSNGAGAAPTWVAPSGGTNTSSALTDGSTITITGPKHTLTSTQATITWTLSQTQDFQTTDIILNATSTTWTFPAGALCVVDGVASGTNTAALSGVSGDHHIMSIYKDGTNYRVAVKNFGQ